MGHPVYFLGSCSKQLMVDYVDCGEQLICGIFELQSSISKTVYQKTNGDSVYIILDQSKQVSSTVLI
jgi:hypothetical protein